VRREERIHTPMAGVDAATGGSATRHHRALHPAAARCASRCQPFRSRQIHHSGEIGLRDEAFGLRAVSRLRRRDRGRFACIRAVMPQGPRGRHRGYHCRLRTWRGPMRPRAGAHRAMCRRHPRPTRRTRTSRQPARHARPSRQDVGTANEGVPAAVLTRALHSRFASWALDELADQAPAMRNRVGGHYENQV
jgi:hypothetical protein